MLLFPLSCEKYSAEIIILQVSLDMALKEGKTQKSRRVFETNCSKHFNGITLLHEANLKEARNSPAEKMS